MEVTADFGSDLKIMNLIRDPSNTLNNMSCEFASDLRIYNIPGPGNADVAYVRLYNFGASSGSVTGTLYDQTGNVLGTPNAVLTNSLPAGGVVVLSSSDIAGLFGIPSWSGRAWMAVNSTLPAGDLHVQNLIRSTILTNMSCVSDRYAHNLPAPDNVDQPFVRFYNTGSSAGAVRGMLRDQNGNVLGTPNSVLVPSLGANGVAVMTSTDIANSFAIPGWTGRAWMEVTADFASDLKIMNLIRDPSNTLNNMSCEFR